MKKNKYLEREFIFAVLTNVLGIAVMFGFIDSEQSESIIKHGQEIYGGLMIVIANASYMISRGLAKSKKGEGDEADA